MPKPPKSGEQTIGPVTQALIKARQLIADPSRHTRGAFARDDHNRSVQATSDAAICWCASGALRRICGIDDFDPRPKTPYGRAQDLLAAASREIMKQEDLGEMRNCITVVNDSAGHIGALRMYNRAIVLARGE